MDLWALQELEREFERVAQHAHDVINSIRDRYKAAEKAEEGTAAAQAGDTLAPSSLPTHVEVRRHDGTPVCRTDRPYRDPRANDNPVVIRVGNAVSIATCRQICAQVFTALYGEGVLRNDQGVSEGGVNV